ncbi:ribosome rescue protein RqcH [Halovenus rubra]|uniref:Archaeal Rqc2 homolog aRqcH n=2 Tax=Halovenus rubra TaxID=869890 RepID=A0ABD5XAD1_9EURY|nr:ribosome rescue protein RqcH [Halovenus rubra]
MEAKREMTSVDIAAFVGEFAAYEGARLDKAYLYEDGMVRLKLRHYDRGRVELLIDIGETKHVRVADPDRVPPAPERPPNFAMMLRNRLQGAELVGINQFEFDRIIEIEFDREDGRTTIVAELFGDGNIAVLDETRTVVDCLDTVRLKSRTVAPGSQYDFPDARFNPLAIEEDGFITRMDQSDTDVVRTLATQLNFGGLWAEEICTRAGVEKTLDIKEATTDDYGQLYDTVQHLSARLSRGDLDARIYFDGESEDDDEDTDCVDVTPVSLKEHQALKREQYDQFTEALDSYFTTLDEEDETPSKSTPDRPDFEGEIEKNERIIEQQKGAIDNFDRQAETEREKAEALYAEYDLVDAILTTVREARAESTPWDDIEARFDEGKERDIEEAKAVNSLDGSEGTVTISVGDHNVTLRVRDGVEKNADRLYKEAKRIEGKKEGAQEAIANTREELEAVKKRREEWEVDDHESTSEPDEESENVDWLTRDSIPIRSSEKWYEAYRWFHTSDGYLVIGGRNADQNEELVKKYLDRGDLFFHTQAHGGPATILKATGPSESYDESIEVSDQAKQEAAEFAVSYSSIWKGGKFAADVYMVNHDQVSKTPESGEYLEKGGFAIRGDRTYFEDTAVGVAVGLTCEPETRVIGGPPAVITERAEAAIEVEPGKYAQNDIAKRLYREFKQKFVDNSFVRKIASPDLIQEFLPPGQSSMTHTD